MWGFLARRMLGAIPLVLGILTLIFFLMHLAPGDPTSRYFDPNISPQVIEQMRQNMGLDQPVPVQYVKWMGAFLTGDFGYSFGQMRPVADILPEVMWNTLQLTLMSLIVTFGVGMLIGIFQAVRQYSTSDNILTIVALFFYSMPGFWLALMLILVFSLKANQLGWAVQFPASQMTSGGYEFLTPMEQLRERIMHLILPSLALGIGSAAGIARYMRGSLLEVIRQDFVRTARAKGLEERVVIFKHALRNALLPIITLLGLTLPFLFSGAVLVEVIFAWPGMGRLIVDAVFQRDYPLIMASSFVIAVLVILGNLVADVLYAIADPRIRTG
ncbi:MAG: ABC transporter permease [Thioalkalivibrio sp.]|nr:ABC transporter permease [Thioalkalivibrio sp.]